MSVGVNVTPNTCPVPGGSTVPALGEYAKVPATLADAFSCAAPSAVPLTMGAGLGQVIVGDTLPAIGHTRPVIPARVVGVQVPGGLGNTDGSE